MKTFRWSRGNPGLLSWWHLPQAQWFTRVLALLVTVSFIFPYLAWAFEAGAYPKTPNALTWGQQTVSIPESAGIILDTHPGTRGLVIHIEDLHCNYEVQDNIAKIIDQLAQARQLGLVGIEGASLPVNTTHLSLYPDAEAKEAVGRHFMRQGKLSGAEFYAATGRHPIELNGVEKPELYAASRELVQAFLNDETQGMVYDLREALDGLKSKLFPPAWKSVDDKKQAFRAGRISSVAYAVFLCTAARQLGLDLGAYPHLAAYAARSVNVLPVSVNPDLIYQEADQADADLRRGLEASAAARELDAWDHRLDVMEKLVNISASPAELSEYRGNPGVFGVGPLVRFLKQYGGRGDDGWDTACYGLDESLKKSAAFYQLADARSAAFVDNLAAQMRTARSDQAVLITGGFHTPQVLAALEARGFAYVSVRPVLRHEDLVNPYFSLVRNRRTPLEKLLAKNQNIFALAPSFAETADRRQVLTPAQEAAQPAARRLFFDALRLQLQNVQLLMGFDALRARWQDQTRSLRAALQNLLRARSTAYPYAAERLALDADQLIVRAEGVEAPFKNLPVVSLVAPATSLDNLSTPTLDAITAGRNLEVAVVENASLGAVQRELAARSASSNWFSSLGIRLLNHLTALFLPWSTYAQRTFASFVSLALVLAPLAALVLSSCDRSRQDKDTVAISANAARPTVTYPLNGNYISNGAQLKAEGGFMVLSGTETRQQSSASVFLNGNQGVSVDLDSQTMRLELNVARASLEWYLIIHDPDLPGGQGRVPLQPETRQTGTVSYDISKFLKDLGLTGPHSLRFELGVSAYGGKATPAVQMAFAPDSSHIVVEGRARSMQPAATGTWVAGASPDFLAKEEVRVAVTKIGTQVKLIGANIGNVPWGHASSLPVTVNLDAENLYFSYSGARELQGRYFIKVQPGAPESALDVVPETDNSFGGRFNLTAILKNAGLHGVQNVKIMVGVVGPGSTPAGARVVLDDFKLESVTAFAPTTVLRPVSGPSAALKAGGIASVQDALKIKANVADRVKAEGPKIFTHLVHWWGPNGTHWNLFGHNPQKDPKDIAAVNHPLLGNYDASTPAYNRWLVRTAKAMGINGVNVDYYAGTEPQDGAALDRLFEAAEAEGKFSVSVMLETRLAKGNLVVLKAQIKTILDKYAVRPSFQRVAGVPVIYTFGLSSTGITPDGYASVIKDLEAEGYVFLLIGDTTTQPAYDGVTSGDHEWINMGVVGKDGRYGSAVGSWEGYQHLNFVARTRDKKTIFSIASIYPGFDDSGVGGNWGQGKPRILDPGNGQVLESTIGAAVEHADRNLWAQVDTWDDHHEATTVEPTLEYGFDRLFSLMVFSARYRGVSSDPQQIINLTESFLKDANHGQVSAEAAAVIAAARAKVPAVTRGIARGLTEFADRTHPFRGITGFLTGLAAGLLSTGIMYINFLVEVQGWAQSVVAASTVMAGVYLVLTFVRFFRVAWAVQNAVYTDRVGREVPLWLRIFSYKFWASAWPAIAWSHWTNAQMAVGTMAVLKQQNPGVYDLILLHESYRGEARGLFALLPGVAEWLTAHPSGTRLEAHGASNPDVIEKIGFTYQEGLAGRQAQIRLLLQEVDKEMAAPGTGQIPEFFAISDPHGDIDRFSTLISHMLTGLLGREVRLDPNQPFGPQLAALPLKNMKGAITINGDFQDRGPEGIKCRQLAEALMAEVPDRVFVNLGNHDFWGAGAILGYQFPVHPGYNFYGNDVAEKLVELFRHDQPALANSLAWWTARADQYEKSTVAFERTHPTAVEAKARRAEFLGYQKAFAGQWNDAQQQAWEDFTGNFARIRVSDACVGLNGVGRTSEVWWQALHQKLLEGHQARSDAGASAEELRAWAQAEELAGRLLVANRVHIAAAVNSGDWWFRVFEAINTQAYASPEWWFMDWVTHKGWGEAVLKELNRSHAEAYEVTPANYTGSRVLQDGARFFLQKTDLFRLDPLGGLISHGWFPLEDNGDVVMTYRGKTGVNRGIFSILKRISATLRNPHASRAQMMEAMTVINDWYADKTTRIKPEHVGQFLERVGVDRILDNLGVWIWATGHNTLDKLDAALTRGERGDAYKLEIDSMMAEKFGGLGTYVRIGAKGISYFGFDATDKRDVRDIVEAPAVKKAGAAPAEGGVMHEGVPAEEFLRNLKNALQKELAGITGTAPAAVIERPARPEAAAPPASVEFSVVQEMKRLREIMPAGPVLNLPLRGLRFLPARLLYYGLRSLLFAADNAAENLNLRAPLQVLSVVFIAGLALLQAAVAVWAVSGETVAVDDLTPRFDALRRTLTLPDSLTARSYNIKQIRFLPLSQTGGFWRRLLRGELLGAYRENAESANPEEPWAALYLPDALLQTLATDMPETDGTLATDLARLKYRAQAFLFGAIVSYESGNYFSAIRWQGFGGRAPLAETAPNEPALSANLQGGEAVTDWFAAPRPKTGISSADVLSLATEYLREARTVLDLPRDQSMTQVLAAWQRELEDGAKPSLATLMRVLASMSPQSVPEGSTAALWRDLIKSKVGVTPATTAIVLSVALRDLISGGRPLAPAAASRGLENVAAGALEDIYIRPIPATSVRELTSSITAALEQLQGKPGTEGLRERLSMMLSFMAGAGTRFQAQQLKAEVARQSARGAAKMDLGEDLKDAVYGVTTDRVQTMVLNGYDFSQPLIYEVAAPADRTLALADLSQPTLPEQVLARAYVGEMEERIKAPWHAWGSVFVTAALFLPVAAVHRWAMRLDPLGYLQSQLTKAHLPANSLEDWLKRNDRPVVQSYLRWAANPKSLRLEREFIKTILRAEKKLAARTNDVSLVERENLVYSVALLSAFAKNMRALVPGIKVGTWSNGAGQVLATRDVYMPGILTLPGSKGALGVHYDIFKGPNFPAAVDESAFELNRRRLFHSTAQAA